MEDQILNVLIAFQGCLVIVFIVNIMAFYPNKAIPVYPSIKTKAKYSTLLLQLIEERILNALF